MKTNCFAIAIDGPVGVGKSTIAKLVANLLSITYIDTGAMYRTVALYCLQNNISNPEGLDGINISLKFEDGAQLVFLNGNNVTDLLRTQEVSAMASQVIAVNPVIREKLVAMQQEMAQATDVVVMDGRDIGSHVLPWAQLKIYLDATPEVRAKRRAAEQESKGEPSDYKQIYDETIARDEIDKNRELNPLIKMDDAICIDTSQLTPDEVAETIVNEAAVKFVSFVRGLLKCSTNL